MNGYYCQSLRSWSHTAWLVPLPLLEVERLMRATREAVRSGQDSFSSIMIKMYSAFTYCNIKDHIFCKWCDKVQAAKWTCYQQTAEVTDTWHGPCAWRFVESIKRDVEVIMFVMIYWKQEVVSFGTADSCSMQMLSDLLSMAIKWKRVILTGNSCS